MWWINSRYSGIIVLKVVICVIMRGSRNEKKKYKPPKVVTPASTKSSKRCQFRLRNSQRIPAARAAIMVILNWSARPAHIPALSMAHRDRLSSRRMDNNSKRIPRKSLRSCRIQNVMQVMELPNRIPHNHVLRSGIIAWAIDAVTTTQSRYAAKTITRGPTNGFSIGSSEPGSARSTYNMGLYCAG